MHPDATPPISPGCPEGTSDLAGTPRAAWALGRGLVTSLRWRLVPPLAVSLALAVAEGAGIVLLVPLLGSIGLIVDQGPVGGIAGWTRDAFTWFGVQPSLTAVLIAFMGISVIYATLYRWEVLLAPATEQAFVVALRDQVFRAVVSAQWSFLVSRRMNDIAHALTVELERVSASAYRLLTLVTNASIAFVYVLVALWLSPALTTVLATGAALALWLLRGRTRDSAEQGRAYADANRRLYGMVHESLAGLKVLKSAGAEARVGDLHQALARTASGRYLDLLRAFADSKWRLDLISAAGLCVLLYLAVGFFEIRGASLLLLMFVFARVMPRMLALQEAMQQFAAGLPAFARVINLLQLCEHEAEPTEAPARSGAVLTLRDRLRLVSVTFTYPTRSHPALSDVSFEFKAGETTAVVGPSGGGKSTLADLVMGLLKPDSGRILIDGAPLTSDRLTAWRRSVGYVPQDTFLLHDTIRANLHWAEPNATEADLWQALEMAAATSFVSAAPLGLDTVVGDRGVRLSGGERQRIALARALLKRPTLLILDEATSALDAQSERHILDAVGRLRGSLTVLLITHRLSAVRDASIIHVLADGRIVESGTWHNLTRSEGGLFHRLRRTQLTGDEAAV